MRPRLGKASISAAGAPLVPLVKQARILPRSRSGIVLRQRAVIGAENPVDAGELGLLLRRQPGPQKYAFHSSPFPQTKLRGAPSPLFAGEGVAKGALCAPSFILFDARLKAGLWRQQTADEG